MDNQTGNRPRSASSDRAQVPNNRLKHYRQKQKSCNFCGYTAKHVNMLLNHIRVHTREKPYKCQHPNCTTVFSTRDNLKRHELIHKKGDKSVYNLKCSVCPYKCALKLKLDRHLKTHSDVKKFGCDLCPYRAKERSTITRHYKEVHSTERPFKCPQPGCLYSSKAKHRLNDHLKVHSDEQPFVCSFENCGFKTKWKNSLRDHKMSHRKQKPVKCPFCGFTCNMRNRLTTHLRGHTGEAPYPCQSCSYRAKTSCCLKIHLKKRHRDEKANKGTRAAIPDFSGLTKPLRCEIVVCPFSTQKHSELALHLSAAHGLPKVVMKKFK